MTEVFSEPDTWDVFVADNMHHLNEAADLAPRRTVEASYENDHVMFLNDVERMVETYFPTYRADPEQTEYEEVELEWKDGTYRAKWRCKACENEWENDWSTPPQFCPYCGREVTNWEEWL